MYFEFLNEYALLELIFLNCIGPDIEIPFFSYIVSEDALHLDHFAFMK